MAITTICLLRTETPAATKIKGARAEPIDDALLIHSKLDFSDDPDSIAFDIRTLVGEALAAQHSDPRGVFLIPSMASPQARSYAAVIEEVGEGGVWAAWEDDEGDDDDDSAGEPDLAGLLGQMMGNMPASMLGAAAQLRNDPNALKEASAALPGLLNDPAAMAQLMSGVSAQMPELSNMLRGLGIDLGSPDMQRMSKELESQLAADPNRLAQLAESMFAGAGSDDEDEDDEDDEEDAPQK